MKRVFFLCLALCLLAGLGGCQNARVEGLTWDADDMVELTIYRTTSYAVTDCKSTQDREMIQQAANALLGVRIQREMRTDDARFEGGITFTFAFTGKDGSCQVIALLENTCLYVEAGPFVLAEPPRPDSEALWDSLPGEPRPWDYPPTPGSYPQEET